MEKRNDAECPCAEIFFEMAADIVCMFCARVQILEKEVSDE